MPRTSTLRDHGLFLGTLLALVVGGLVLQSPAALQTGSSNNQNPLNSVLRMMPATANADSNSTMIAVTGTDLTGSSVLYLVDTVQKQLAIYQANGGGDSLQGVKLIGARKIDLDLQLEGYNDHSKYSYEDLEKQFQENNRAAAPAKKN